MVYECSIPYVQTLLSCLKRRQASRPHPRARTINNRISLLSSPHFSSGAVRCRNNKQHQSLIGRRVREIGRLRRSVRNSAIVKLQTFGNRRNSVIQDCVASLFVDQKTTQDLFLPHTIYGILIFGKVKLALTNHG